MKKYTNKVTAQSDYGDCIPYCSRAKKYVGNICNCSQKTE